jgi:drug/metabolite transporter (DMT)-like permease
LLTNCAPLFVPLIAWVWLKKKVIYALWPPIFIGLVGIILILKPDRDIFNVGALYAIASGIATAVSIITLRMSTHTDKLEAVLFYSYLVGLLLSIPFIFSYWALPSTTILWGLIGIGVFSFLGQWGLFKSLQFGKAAPIASFGYACVIYSGFFDWLIFQHIPDIWTFAGALLVIVGGVWVVILNKPPNTTPYQN